jgi:hypothetical protein
MTPKQKLFIAALVIANGVVILTLIALVARSPRTSPSPLPTPAIKTPTLRGSIKPPTQAVETPTAKATRPKRPTQTPQDTASTPATPLPETCQWKATQLLAQAGLGGTVTSAPDSTLRFDIVHPLAPGQTADEAAQSVWTAFDIALALVEQEDECDLLGQIEVAILAQGSLTDTQINANVSIADLVAFGAGELTEEEFAARVTYQVGSR